ncbi:MAG: hypothetical protein LBQ87_05200 [Candidatus Fibromonas sp.]|jgi:hypothetical protein|nr:hypothetical protein [Candidatus Fibromonas sp.]
MFSIDLIQIAILWSIAGLGFICAINARGFFRQVVSWLIVISMAVIAVFFSYIKFETVKQETGFSEKESSSSSTVSSSSSTSNSAEASEMDSISASFFAARRQLIQDAIVISDLVMSFPNWKSIYSQGIENREGFESKALSLRNRSANSYRQIRALVPPEAEKQSYDSLLAATDNLRLAGYEIHSQFGLEADTLGENISRARERAKQAKLVFYTIINEE